MSARVNQSTDLSMSGSVQLSVCLSICVCVHASARLNRSSQSLLFTPGEEIKNDTEQSNTSVPVNDDPTTPNYIKRQRRRQSRVDCSLRQAPLSDRTLSIIAPQNRRSSILHTLEICENDDVQAVLPASQLKFLRVKRHSLAVNMSETSRDRPPRRLSVDVSKVRNNNFGDGSKHDFSSNKTPRRYPRDIQGRSRASVDITADRITARPDFERMTSQDSVGSTCEDDKPKHRVTMDLIGTAMALFLQDGPFLTFRLFMIAKYSAIQYMIVFLTVKNALLLVLQIYKITVQHCVCYDHKDNDFSPENRVDATSRLNNVQIAVIDEETKKAGPSFKARRGRYNRFSARWSRTKTGITGPGPLFHTKAKFLERKK